MKLTKTTTVIKTEVVEGTHYTSHAAARLSVKVVLDGRRVRLSFADISHVDDGAFSQELTSDDLKELGRALIELAGCLGAGSN